MHDSSAAERKLLPEVVGHAAEVVEALLCGSLAAAQNEFHTTPELAEQQV